MLPPPILLVSKNEQLSVSIEYKFYEKNSTILNETDDIWTFDLPNSYLYTILDETYNINETDLQKEIKIFVTMFKSKNTGVVENTLKGIK